MHPIKFFFGVFRKQKLQEFKFLLIDGSKSTEKLDVKILHIQHVLIMQDFRVLLLDRVSVQFVLGVYLGTFCI
jgi:hypothetical protein